MLITVSGRMPPKHEQDAMNRLSSFYRWLGLTDDPCRFHWRFNERAQSHLFAEAAD